MADPVAQGHQAASEYEQLALAFLAVREGYTKKALASNDPDEAFRHVLAVKALSDVEASMRAVIDGGKLEEKFPAQ